MYVTIVKPAPQDAWDFFGIIGMNSRNGQVVEGDSKHRVRELDLSQETLRNSLLATWIFGWYYV